MVIINCIKIIGLLWFKISLMLSIKRIKCSTPTLKHKNCFSIKQAKKLNNKSKQKPKQRCSTDSQTQHTQPTNEFSFATHCHPIPKYDHLSRIYQKKLQASLFKQFLQPCIAQYHCYLGLSLHWDQPVNLFNDCWILYRKMLLPRESNIAGLFFIVSTGYYEALYAQ